jgi:hypothetical protein
LHFEVNVLVIDHQADTSAGSAVDAACKMANRASP